MPARIASDFRKTIMCTGPTGEDLGNIEVPKAAAIPAHEGQENVSGDINQPTSIKTSKHQLLIFLILLMCSCMGNSTVSTLGAYYFKDYCVSI